MSINTKRGFTLMELLVVIAIIGILASVVLASLNSARNKGADAAIKSSINNTRAQAEISYDQNNSSYASVCTDTTILNAQSAVNNAGGAFVCANSATAYSISSYLKTSTSTYYCVDSTGKSTTTVTVPSGVACP